MIRNKKAFSEITSFVLLFSIIAIASTVAYTFSKGVIDDKTSEIDAANALSYLKKFNEKIGEIKTFEDSTFSINLNFKTGQYIFQEDKIFYYSMIDYTGSDYCINSICHQNNNGVERLYITLEDSYTFMENISLIPGSYFLTFVNIKNETKIEIKLS
jgi:hypothetical protein